MKSLTAGIIVSICMGCAVAYVSEEGISATIKVGVDKVLEEDFLGVGVRWSSYPWWDVSTEDWNKVFKRLEYMQMPFARVMLDAFWYCQGFDDKGKPDKGKIVSKDIKACLSNSLQRESS